MQRVALLFSRFISKFTFEVVPAVLASVIAAATIAYLHLGRPADHVSAPLSAVARSGEEPSIQAQRDLTRQVLKARRENTETPAQVIPRLDRNAIAAIAAAAGNAQGPGEAATSGEGMKAAGESGPTGEPLKEQTQTRTQMRDQLCDQEDCDQLRTRVRSELRAGAYPEEVPGEGGRDRTRERSTEESQSAETSDTVTPPDDPDDGSGDTTETVEPTDTPDNRGFWAGVVGFFSGIARSFGL